MATGVSECLMRKERLLRCAYSENFCLNSDSCLSESMGVTGVDCSMEVELPGLFLSDFFCVLFSDSFLLPVDLLILREEGRGSCSSGSLFLVRKNFY